MDKSTNALVTPTPGGSKPWSKPMITQTTDSYIDGLVQDCSISSALANHQHVTRPKSINCVL